jgi:hypothetical protein
MMNDADLITAVRESFSGIHAATPLEVVVRRGRMRRARHRIAGLAGAAALAVVAALAVTSLVPGAGQVRLAAWTVATRPGGTVTVYIHQLRDAAGLQQTLRADGVPATVRFVNQNPPPCLYYPYHPQQPIKLDLLLRAIFLDSGSTASASGAAFAIKPSAIPRGAGVWIQVSPPQNAPGPPGSGLETTSFATAWALVYASGHCPPR